MAVFRFPATSHCVTSLLAQLTVLDLDPDRRFSCNPSTPTIERSFGSCSVALDLNTVNGGGGYPTQEAVPNIFPVLFMRHIKIQPRVKADTGDPGELVQEIQEPRKFVPGLFSIQIDALDGNGCQLQVEGDQFSKILETSTQLDGVPDVNEIVNLHKVHIVGGVENLERVRGVAGEGADVLCIH